MKKIITILFIANSLWIKAQTSDRNFVTTHTARIEEKVNLLSAISDHTQVAKSTQYYDGLGRPMQSILSKASPGGYDLITPIVHDKYGRQTKDYRSYYFDAGSSAGNYRSNWSGEIDAVYQPGSNNNIADEDSYYYSERVFEPSPLNRVDELFGPGTYWRTPNSKPAKYTYRANTTGTGSAYDNIPMFVVNSSTQYISYVSKYPTGSLWVVQTADENGNRVLEFSDKLGRMVCKKSEYSTDNFTSTLYLYDEFGNLTFVVPPEAASQASTAWETNLNNSSFSEKWLFRYRYDDRNRMIEKQVPGGKPGYMVYDRRDRLVFTQDGNQGSYETITTAVIKERYDGNSYQISGSGSVTLNPGFEFSASSTNTFHISSSVPERVWLFTKYDALDRPVMTGVFRGNQTRNQLQSTVDGISNFMESYTGSGVLDGYDNAGYPTKHGDNVTDIDIDDILTITYYDDYDFTSEGNPTGALEPVKGQVTGTKAKILGTSTFLTGITWYDDRYRVIKTKKDNHLGGYDIHDLTYFNKVRPTVNTDTHTHNDGSTDTEIIHQYYYDHMDRLLKITHEIDPQNPVTLQESSYNEIGELIEKNLGVSTSPVQSIDYQYNIRGWLTSINDATLNDADGNDKFGMELVYNYSNGNGEFNGNIDKVTWKQAGQSQWYYSYTYDKLNRLTNANDDEDFQVENINYDLNGNIGFLARYQNASLKDILTYQYNGNQLTSVGDSQNNELFDEQYSEGLQADEYLYDMNGNMIRDANKGISSISYNYLNLPEKVNLPNGDYVKYTYDATGMKLSKETTVGADLDYVGPIHYRNGAIEFIQTSEGRVVKSGGTYNHEYDLTDHLGNVRATVNSSGTVVQRDDYYPFGGRFNTGVSNDNKYLYNGKELQDETQVYDYGWRHYDPWIGRFSQIDRFIENYMPVSPYSYVANNPIKNVDINGDYITIMGEDKYGNKYSVLYENRKAYHYSKDKYGNIIKGDEYDGSNEFIENAIVDLNRIADTGEGGEVVGQLTTSTSEYGINKASSLTGSRFKPNVNSNDDLTSGGQLYYSQKAGRLDGVNFKGTYTLGHELYHAYQRDLGASGYMAMASVTGEDGIVPLAETQAVGFENYLRATLNESNYNTVRQTYTSKFLNITTPVLLKEYQNMGGWPQIGLGRLTPWNITEFINKKEEWKNLRRVAQKAYSSD